MAARRLKFKPKPLVGLIRRNKDQNEQDTLENNDIIKDATNSSCTISSGNNIAASPNREECCDVVTNSDDPSKNSNANKFRDCQESNIDAESGTVLLDNVNCENNCKSSENTAVQNNLKCDINSKIKSVLSGCNLGNNCFNTSDSYNNGSINSGGDNVASVSDLIGEKVTEDVKSDSTDVPSEQTPRECVNSISKSKINRPTEGSDSSAATSSKDDVSDKKDIKSNSNQRILSRFGKARLKPTLSNVRNKKDATVEVNNKDDRPITVPETHEVAKPKILEVDSSKIIPVTKQQIENDVNSSNISNEAPVQVENQNVCDDPTTYESCSDVQLSKELSTVAINAAEIEKPPEATDKTLNSGNCDSALTSTAPECDDTPEDGSVRTPVKLFQPNKRQRSSQGQAFTSLTVKAMRSFKSKFKDGHIDKSKLMMRDLIFYNPTSNPMPPRQLSKNKKEDSKQESTKSTSLVDDLLEEEKVDDIENEDNDSLPVPQVKVGPDGKIIIDPRSLVIEATGVQKNRENLEKSEVLQENEFSHSKYQRKKVRRSEWTAEETLLFYKALNDIGADFSLMQSLFPKRTRRDLKLKFKKEERVNCNLIDKAMTSSGNFDFTSLENELKKDREERIRKLEEQKKHKEEKKKQAMEKKLIKPQKRENKRKSIAQREFDPSDSGVIRVGKKYEDEMEMLKFKQNNETSVEKPTCVKKVIRRTRKKRRKLEDYEDSSSMDEPDMFDFRLKDSDDENDSANNDGIDVNDRDPSVVAGKRVISDDESDSNGFNSRILKQTRYGRQPKPKVKNDLETVEYIRQLKKFKQSNNDEGIVKESLNPELFSETHEMETVMSDVGRIQKLSSLEIDEKLENCYQLFGEPLNLSMRNDSNEMLLDDLNSISVLNDNSSLPTFDNKNFLVSSEIDVENDKIKQTQKISEALQIVEELTSENDIDYNLQDVNESNCLYLPSNIRSEQCTSINRYDDLTPSSSHTSEQNVTEYSDLDESNAFNTSDEFCSENTSKCSPPILINTIQPGTTRVQVVSKEQLSYLIRQSSNIILDHTEECSEKPDEVESISPSRIHCYPSSDHNYTSLIPKPTETKSTYLLLTPMNLKELS